MVILEEVRAYGSHGPPNLSVNFGGGIAGSSSSRVIASG